MELDVDACVKHGIFVDMDLRRLNTCLLMMVLDNNKICILLARKMATACVSVTIVSASQTAYTKWRRTNEN